MAEPTGRPVSQGALFRVEKAGFGLVDDFIQAAVDACHEDSSAWRPNNLSHGHRVWTGVQVRLVQRKFLLGRSWISRGRRLSGIDR